MDVIDLPMLIGGKLVESEGAEWLESHNPADEELIGRVPRGSQRDVEAAVEAGLDAFPAWAGLPMSARAKCLRELGRKLTDRAEEILELEVRDTGNTITKMRADVARAVEALDYFAGIGLEVKGETVPATPGNIHFSVREPYGVVGRIIPFNHPLQFAVSRIAAPLMAGNAVVVKPSHQSPLSAGMLAELCQGVFAPGVVNIVTGMGTEAGDALVRHPRVKRLAFIGSAATGMAIQRAAAEVAVKHVTLELGGKNPMVVFPDADLGRAVQAAVNGMNFAWSGQSCGSVSRLFLHESVYEEGLAQIKDLVERLRIGNPLDPASDMGPVNSKAQYDKVLRYLELGKEQGARLVTGGNALSGDGMDRGYWVQPTVFADVSSSMRIFQEEIFGPVMSVCSWSDPEEMIRDANAVEYGLTAAVWTNDLQKAFTTAQRIQAGYIWINGVSAHYTGCSFGGMKNSGIGREEGLEEIVSYTEGKTIHVHLT